MELWTRSDIQFQQREVPGKVADDRFHEEEIIRLKLGRVVTPGELNRVLKGLKFKLFYDVYGMESCDGEDWQSETYVDVEILFRGDETDAQGECDELRLAYPLARVDSSYIEKFADLCEVLKLKLGGELFLNNDKTNHKGILDYFTQCVSELMEEWGEEPGSKGLAFLIESSYG